MNVRFIAATNANPQDATESGQRHLDLFYRLHVVPIALPALRSRQEDITLLANHFLRHYWNNPRGREEKRPMLSDAAIEALRRYKWPGNVRELQNLIERVVVPESQLQPGQLPFFDDSGILAGEVSVWADDRIDQVPYHSTRDQVLADFERRYLTGLLNRASGNMSKAARMAGVDRTTLYRLMEKREMQRESIMIGAEVK